MQVCISAVKLGVSMGRKVFCVELRRPEALLKQQSVLYEAHSERITIILIRGLTWIPTL